MHDGSDRPAVSVVIINKDEREIKRSLDLLLPQIEAFAGGAEVVIVDASEGRLDDIRGGAPWARWIPFRRPIGATTSIPHQRNVGVRASLGAVIAFCDAGGEPGEHWLETLVRPILDGRQDASCGPVVAIGESVYGVMTDIADGEIPATPPTANMAFRRSVFDAVGGFDEQFRYGSDVDFAWRLEDNATPVRQVRAAVMHMDWGDRKRQTARSRLYGAGQAQLWMKHRHRWRRLPRTVPVLIVYPLWLLAIIPAAFQLLRRKPALFGLWAAVPAALLVKNRREPDPIDVVRQNALFGRGALEMVAKRCVPRRAPVLFVPKEDGVYQGRLRRELAAAGADTDYLVGPSGSHALNLLLLPLQTVAARIGGARIVHIHWTYDFRPAWAEESATAKRLCRWWFVGWLRLTRAIGLRIVWTAHNHLPHRPVFDDDRRARRSLVAACDAVVALTDASADELDLVWDARPIMIPLAVEGVEAGDRQAARAALSIQHDRPMVAWFGLVEEYKGLDHLVAAAALLPEVTFVLAGVCRDPKLASRLGDAVAATPNVRWIDRRVTDAELSDLCAAADLLAFPFTSVTNSGSVLTALSAARPVLLPSRPILAEIPSSCSRRAEARDPNDIAVKIGAFLALHPQQRLAMEVAAHDFGRQADWSAVAAAHVALYRTLGA